MEKFHIVLFLLVVTNLTSCKKDFLEVVDKTVLLKEGYVVDLETTAHFMTGVYLSLASNYVSGAALPYPEIQADNMKPLGGFYFSVAYNWSFKNVEGEGFGDPVALWRQYYSLIRSCNYVIEKAEEYKDQNINKSNDIRGQALAIRAMMHFVLVNMFAQSYNYSPDGSHLGVPYIKSSDIQTPVSRQTVSEDYAEMIEDLNNAIQLLPSSAINKEVMNFQAAKALLSRVYLFKEDYSNAKNIALQILNDIPIMSATDYPSKLYTLDDSEAIFWMRPDNSDEDGYYAVFIGFHGSIAGNGQYLASDDIVQSLKEDSNDKRSAWVTQVFGVYWLITKFPTAVTGTFPLGPDGDYYQTLFRSSELCLTAAESYAKINMEDSARYYIDQIRLRANPTLANITATSTALLDSIYKERRKEMCFDGLRMWDLQRWKKGVFRSDPNDPSVQMLTYPNDKAVAALPKVDVELGGLPQNPGY